MNDIKCPHCGKLVHIDEVLRHELEKTIIKDVEDKQKVQLEKARAQAFLDAEKKFKEDSQKDITRLNKEKLELEKILEENKKEQEKNAIKIKEDAIKQTLQASRLEKLEYEKKINDMQKALEDAQRKSKQGSQQLQGEILELDLEKKLKEAFPTDEFLPIPKGVEGADILQKVKLQGQTTGSIIWETKRTKQWSKLWLTKLKDDAAKVSATEAIIVSQVLPDDSVSFDRKENVWITNYEQAVSIAKYVRFLINAIYKMKSSTSQTNEDWTKVRDYMLSDSFKHRMQAHFDAVKNLREMLDTEKRTSTLRWVRQQKQIDKLDSNTVNFYAELKDIVNNLPELEEIESTLIQAGNENEQEPLI